MAEETSMQTDLSGYLAPLDLIDDLPTSNNAELRAAAQEVVDFMRIAVAEGVLPRMPTTVKRLAEVLSS
jgi:hypothetical protein